ncbi:hypothetical protein G3576_04070 [Roseomonas stagni]|uniref:DUF3592 domain-containing protein n=1 Tax=Falsiroseomonas algicola TaxID=2716930 RepID=A0A6M1LGM9_9PROT|nr:hypothetical protein [Falsiroseomonas algicola]NGM19179.1 hypothetical protein [Falsiroseomonas algicola]
MTERPFLHALRWRDRASQAADARNRFIPATRRVALAWIVMSTAFLILEGSLARLLRERWMALTWTKVEASVTGVAPGGERHPNRGFPFLVSLEATLPDGRVMATPAPVLLFSRTLDPGAPARSSTHRSRAPQPGQTLPAYVDAHGTGAFVPVERMLPFWLTVPWVALPLLTIGFGLWRLFNPPPAP